MTTPDIRILVISRGGMLQQSILSLLDSEFATYQLFVTSRVDVAKKLVAKEALRLVIIDIHSLDQHRWVNEIRAASPHTHILVLDSFEILELQERMVRAGAQGVFSWRCSREEITQGIKGVLAGKICLSHALEQQVLRRSMADHTLYPPSSYLKDNIENLSPRQRQVLQLIGQSKTLNQIAKELKISFKTVKIYRKQAKTRLSIRSGSELARIAAIYALLSEK